MCGKVVGKAAAKLDQPQPQPQSQIWSRLLTLFKETTARSEALAQKLIFATQYKAIERNAMRSEF